MPPLNPGRKARRKGGAWPVKLAEGGGSSSSIVVSCAEHFRRIHVAFISVVLLSISSIQENIECLAMFIMRLANIIKYLQ